MCFPPAVKEKVKCLIYTFFVKESRKYKESLFDGLL